MCWTARRGFQSSNTTGDRRNLSYYLDVPILCSLLCLSDFNAFIKSLMTISVKEHSRKISRELS
jgi:hypothetical protein